MFFGWYWCWGGYRLGWFWYLSGWEVVGLCWVWCCVGRVSCWSFGVGYGLWFCCVWLWVWLFCRCVFRVCVWWWVVGLIVVLGSNRDWWFWVVCLGVLRWVCWVVGVGGGLIWFCVGLVIFFCGWYFFSVRLIVWIGGGWLRVLCWSKFGCRCFCWCVVWLLDVLVFWGLCSVFVFFCWSGWCCGWGWDGCWVLVGFCGCIWRVWIVGLRFGLFCRVFFLVEFGVLFFDVGLGDCGCLVGLLGCW